MVNLRLTSWAIFNQNHPILTQKVVNFRDFCLNFWKNVNFGPLWKPLVKTQNTKYVFKTFSAPLETLKKVPWIKDFLNFWYYSNSILCTFKSMQHIHYMVIYTIISCIILYSKSFMYIMYSFWSHCEYILSTSILISSTIAIKEWEWISLTR